MRTLTAKDVVIFKDSKNSDAEDQVTCVVELADNLNSPLSKKMNS